MNLKKLGRTLWVIAAVAILAMVLQGCGGDDNGVSQDQQDNLDLLQALRGVELPEGMELTVASLMALAGRADISQADHQALEDALGGMELTPATLMMLAGRADITQGAYDALEMALGGMTLDSTTLMMLAGRANISQADYQALVNALGGMMLDPATLMMLVETYNESKEEEGKEQESMAQADMDQRGMSVRAAMMGTDTAPMVGVSWKNGAPSVALKGYTSGDAPPAIDGWTNVTLERTRDMPVGGTDSVYVYTDIAAPTAEEFGDVYTVATDGTIQIRNAPNIAADPPLYDDNNAVSSKIPARTDTTYDHWDATLDTPAKRDAFSGTYDGVSGMFDCAATAVDQCTITVMEDDDGDLIPVFTGSWTFDPGNVEHTVMVDDDDFLTFGYWLYKPIESEDEHIFAAFSMGSKPYDNDLDGDNAVDFSGVDGTATYRGSAGGKYVVRDAIAEKSDIGLFTAKAKLDANFGTADTTDTDDRITGVIDNFVSGDGTALTGWSITLGTIAATTANITGATGVIDGANDGNVTSGVIAGVTIMPGAADSNNDWDATFHGNAMDRTDMQPGSIVGTFDLHGGTETQVSVSGGFGAHNISPEN